METEREDLTTLALVAALERNVSQQAFQTWFKPLRITEAGRGGTIRILVPSAVAKEWILSNYSQALDQSLRESNVTLERVEWYTTSANHDQTEAGNEQSSSMFDNQHGDTGLVPTDPSQVSSPSLNERYTFAGFVVGSCNRFAHAAAQAVADTPGKTYNPLYIYGGVGLGKTHLLQATGHAIKASNPSLQIVYVSLERFMNELINAIRYGYDKTQLFREKYRSIDVLLIDDVQFIAGKERTQEEFFHTFNALYDAQKQIVLTSDCPPREIREIEERLHSRFEWGLIADLEPPDLETKVAILKRKAESHRVHLSDDVAFFLASNSKHNIRELEGSLIRVQAMASLRGCPVSKELVREALRYVSHEEEHNAPSVPRIQKAVAEYYKISVDNLKLRSNARHVLVPRQVAMYLCKRLTKASYPEIARQFAGKHHTTVIHSVEKIEGLLTKDSEVCATVKSLIEGLSN